MGTQMTTETQFKGTPGPWLVDEEKDGWGRTELRIRKGEFASTIVGAGMLAWVRHDFLDVDRANARLIAAAPDLLEALQFALPFVPSPKFPDETDGKGKWAAFEERYAAARAAIAKALGEPS